MFFLKGGGASVIYADTVVDLGFGDELANYGIVHMYYCMQCIECSYHINVYVSIVVLFMSILLMVLLMFLNRRIFG